MKFMAKVKEFYNNNESTVWFYAVLCSVISLIICISIVVSAHVKMNNLNRKHQAMNVESETKLKELQLIYTNQRTEDLSSVQKYNVNISDTLSNNSEAIKEIIKSQSSIIALITKIDEKYSSQKKIEKDLGELSKSVTEMLHVFDGGSKPAVEDIPKKIIELKEDTKEPKKKRRKFLWIF